MKPNRNHPIFDQPEPFAPTWESLRTKEPLIEDFYASVEAAASSINNRVKRQDRGPIDALEFYRAAEEQLRELSGRIVTQARKKRGEAFDTWTGDTKEDISDATAAAKYLAKQTDNEAVEMLKNSQELRAHVKHFAKTFPGTEARRLEALLGDAFKESLEFKAAEEADMIEQAGGNLFLQARQKLQDVFAKNGIPFERAEHLAKSRVEGTNE